MINEGKKSRCQEGKQISSLHTLAPCGRGQGEGLYGLSRPHFVRPRNDESIACHAEFISASCNCELQKEIAPTLTLPHKGGDKNSFLNVRRSEWVPINNVNSLPSCLPDFQTAKRTAFTLAEVLITLGIIGIVAAMTLPALIQGYKRHEATARLKKFNTTFNQVMMFSENDNGPSKDWGRNGDILDESGNMDWSANFGEQRRFFEKYFAPYMEYIDIKDGETDTDEEGNISVKSQVTIYLKDGSSMHLYNGGAFDIVFDYNGDKRPNKIGYDQFNFEVCPESYASMFFPANHNFGTRRVIWDRGNFTREQYLKYCKDNALYCARLLEMDNWEFKKDYPYGL